MLNKRVTEYVMYTLYRCVAYTMHAADRIRLTCTLCRSAANVTYTLRKRVADTI